MERKRGRERATAGVREKTREGYREGEKEKLI